MRKRLHSIGRAITRDRGGNIAITTALTLPLVIAAMALGIDYGHLTLQQRGLQNAADLAAIAAAGNIGSPEQAVLDYFQMNGQNFGVKVPDGLLTAKGKVPFDALSVYNSYDGYAELVPGRYVPDASRSVSARFEANAKPYDAVRVSMHQNGAIFFAGSFTGAPELGATGTAAVDKYAAFSIGSRLASVNEGILNALLGKLLGTTISLKVADYQALLDTQINALKTLDALALDLGLTAGTYSNLLKTQISYGKLVTALGKTTGLTPAVTTILKSLDKSKVTLKLENVLALGPYADRLIGQSDNFSLNASLLELISASATAANGGQQLAVDLGTTIPGVGSTKLTVAIGQPPVGTPFLNVGAVGSIVRTAQIRIAAEVVLDGLTSTLLGLKVRVPLYVEVGNAEARLSSITCSATPKNGATVEVEAVPGVVELAVADIDTSAFANFGKKPRATAVDLVSSPLLDVSALSYSNATNISPTKISFSPTEITAGKLKSVSTKDTLTTLISSLLTSLELKVDLLGLPLVLPKTVTSAVAETLKLATAPLDAVLYNTLLALGVKIGEADVRVTGTQCRNPVLVQ